MSVHEPPAVDRLPMLKAAARDAIVGGPRPTFHWRTPHTQPSQPESG
jgi:hypothetical protein